MKNNKLYKFQYNHFIEYYERVSNWQTIKIAPSGEGFIRVNGKICTLTEFTPFGSPWIGGEPFEIKTESGKTATICAVQQSYPCPYFLEVDEQSGCVERARVFQLRKREEII